MFMNTTNNFSTNSFGNSTHNSTNAFEMYEEPSGLMVFRLTIAATVMLASLLGNAVVLKAVFDSTTRKAVTHYLVANLAFAELFSTVLNVFLQVYTELKSFPFGPVMCRVLNPLHSLNFIVITYTLSAIALHRYRVFSRDHPKRPMTPRQTYLVIVILWVMALAIAFPSFLFQRLVRAPGGEGRYWCIDLFPGDTIESFPSQSLKKYYLAKFILNYFLPIIIMSLSYGFVGVKLRHHRNRSIRAQEEDSSDNHAETTQQENISTMQPHITENKDAGVRMQTIKEENNSTSRPARRVRRRMHTNKGFADLEKNILKMFYAIIIIFVGFYFPYQVFFILEYFNILHWTTWKYFDITRDYIYLLTHFPSALHPLCYGTMSKFFARAFSRLILCKKHTR